MEAKQGNITPSRGNLLLLFDLRRNLFKGRSELGWIIESVLSASHFQMSWWIYSINQLPGLCTRKEHLQPISKQAYRALLPSLGSGLYHTCLLFAVAYLRYFQKIYFEFWARRNGDHLTNEMGQYFSVENFALSVRLIATYRDARSCRV